MSSTSIKPTKPTDKSATKSAKSANSPTSQEPKEQSLADKIETLNARIDWFYGDDFTLADASTKYKEALGLADEIEKDLENLKNEIEIIDRDFTK